MVKHESFKGDKFCHCVVNRICIWCPNELVGKIFTVPSSLVFEDTELMDLGMYMNYIAHDLISYDVQAFLKMLLSEGYSYDICQTFKSCPKETDCYDDTVANVLAVM